MRRELQDRRKASQLELGEEAGEGASTARSAPRQPHAPSCAERDGTYRPKGESLLAVEAWKNRVANPVPRNIGCPYASWSGANKCTYW